MGSFRPGDWMCPKCDYHNFAKNDECMKCNEPKPADADAKKPLPGGQERCYDFSVGKCYRGANCRFAHLGDSGKDMRFEADGGGGGGGGRDRRRDRSRSRDRDRDKDRDRDRRDRGKDRDRDRGRKRGKDRRDRDRKGGRKRRREPSPSDYSYSDYYSDYGDYSDYSEPPPEKKKGRKNHDTRSGARGQGT